MPLIRAFPPYVLSLPGLPSPRSHQFAPRCRAASHPNVQTGENVIPVAVDRETTVRRLNEWCPPLAPSEKPDSECFELPGFLNGATAKSQSGTEFLPLKPGHYRIMQPQFAYMVLGQYPSQGSNVLISKEWILQARNRWDEFVRANGETPSGLSRPIGGLDRRTK